MSKDIKAPEGYTEQSSDLVGFWEPEKNPPVHVIPRYAKMMDSEIDENKTSTLLVCEVVDRCVVLNKDKEEVLADKGQNIGVWYKPGMSGIKNLGGIPVFIRRDAENDQDTGKPSLMKTFRVMSKGRGSRIPVENDYRKTSKGGAESGKPAELMFL